MEDQSGETVLYDKVALRFKGGCFLFIFSYADLTEDLSTRILDNKVLRKRLVVRFFFLV